MTAMAKRSKNRFEIKVNPAFEKHDLFSKHPSINSIFLKIQ